MCSPHCIHAVSRRLTRRSFFSGLGFVAAGTAAAMMAPRRPAFAQPRSFTRVVDLTHPTPEDFPTFFGEQQLFVERKFTWAEHRFNLNEWRVDEHTGTHMDAPIHFSEAGQTADEVPVENLVAPLCVIDIRGKAQDDPDAQVTPEDVAAWESRHGDIPDGAVVAMNSGWDRHVASPVYRNADGEGVMHFPGVHPETALMLIETRNVVGMGVDTLSLDHGPSQDFATHYAWLPTNRWGVECLANLGDLPPSGATIVMGGPRIKGASGGPSRVVALV